MTEFKARLPRGKPEKGMAFVVVSVKEETGTRIEMTGAIPHRMAMDLFEVLQNPVAPKPEKDAA